MAAGASLTGRMAKFAAGTGRVATTGSAAAALVLIGVSAALVLLDASAPGARVWVTAAVLRFGSDGGVLLDGAAAVLDGAAAVLEGTILPDTAGACAWLGSGTCGRTGSLGVICGFGSGSDFWAACTFGAG